MQRVGRMRKWIMCPGFVRKLIALAPLGVWSAFAHAETATPIAGPEPRVIVVSSSQGGEPTHLARNARDVVERAVALSAPHGARIVVGEKFKTLVRRFERSRRDDPPASIWTSAEAALKAYDNADLTEARTLLKSVLPALIDRPYVIRGDEKRISLRRRALLCLALIHLANRDNSAAEKVIRQLIHIDPHYEPRAREYPSRFIAQIARLRSDVLTSMMRVNVEPISAASGYLVNGIPVAAQVGQQQIMLPAGVAWFQWKAGNALGPLVRVEGKSEEPLTVRPDPAREQHVVADGGHLHLVFRTRGDAEAGEKEIGAALAMEADANATIVVRGDGTVVWVARERNTVGKLDFPPRADQAAREIARLAAPPANLAVAIPAAPKPKTRFRVWKWMAAGVGLATTAMGLTFALLAQSSQREYDETPQTPSTVAALRELETTGETRSHIATGAFIAGGVLMASAALLFAIDKPVSVVIDTRRTTQLPIASFALGLRWSLR